MILDKIAAPTHVRVARRKEETPFEKSKGRSTCLRFRYRISI